MQDHLANTNHVYSPWIVMVSKSWWDMFSADDQKVLMDASIASRDFERVDTRAASAKALDEMKAAGRQIVEMPPEKIAKMLVTAQPIIGAAIDTFGRPLTDEALAELAKLRQAVARRTGRARFARCRVGNCPGTQSAQALRDPRGLSA